MTIRRVSPCPPFMAGVGGMGMVEIANPDPFQRADQPAA